MANKDTSISTQAGSKQMQSPESTFVCQRCHDLCRWHLEPDWVGEAHKHHEYLQVLQASAQTCTFCSIFLRNLSMRYNNTQLGVDNQMCYEIYTDHKRYGYVEIAGRVPGLKSKDDHANLWLSCSETTIWSRSIWQSTTPDWKGRLSTLREWIWECNAHDKKCKESVHNRPKRLIDLGPMVDGMDPKLVYATRTTEDMRYTTLSHCWGPPDTSGPLKTTKENEKSYLDRVPLHEMPQSFKDAILVTRRIGVRYLWIDSLCIVQDDRAEWATESANMAAIYLGSFLTIADGISADSHGGFLGEYQASADEEFSVAQISDGPWIVDFTIRSNLVQTKQWLEQSPLMRRGWTLQELVLSPRIVLFTPREMLWQCRRNFSSEGGQESISSRLTSRGQKSVFFDLERASYSSTLWTDWIESYAERRLTYLSDQAPALAGLINFYQSRTRFTALLGLWQETLQTDLAWFRRPSRGATVEVERQDKSSDFPSWTYLPFMCTPGFKLGWGGDHDFIDLQPFRIISFEVEWEDQPFVSKLKSSHLAVSGLVKEAYIGISNTQSILPGASSIRGADLPEFGDIRLYDKTDKQVAVFYPDFEYTGEQKLRLSTPEHRLLVKVLFLYHEDFSKFAYVGLVLQAVEDGSSVYRRLGIAKGVSGPDVHLPHLDEKFFKTFDEKEDIATCTLV